MDTLLLAKVALFAIPVALVAVAFTRASHGLAAWTKARIAHWTRAPPWAAWRCSPSSSSFPTRAT